MDNKPAHLKRGMWAEELACDYLISQQLAFVARNFRCAYGEIDLIMAQGEKLVMVEVRYRKNAWYGSAQESVNAAKQRKIIAATYCYLDTQHFSHEIAIRFDVVAISGSGEVTWIKNAFGEMS